jgi:hypothetical protein
MRTAQNTYFAKRLRRDLIESKELEKQVDRALDEGIEVDLYVDLETLRTESAKLKVETVEQGDLFETEADDE